MFYLKDNDFILFGASPESALKYTKQSNEVEIYPIAGTRTRGFNKDGSISKDLDSRLELELRLDKKETSEKLTRETSIAIKFIINYCIFYFFISCC